jgi:hypothetical protein
MWNRGKNGFRRFWRAAKPGVTIEYGAALKCGSHKRKRFAGYSGDRLFGGLKLYSNTELTYYINTAIKDRARGCSMNHADGRRHGSTGSFFSGASFSVRAGAGDTRNTSGYRSAARRRTRRCFARCPNCGEILENGSKDVNRFATSRRFRQRFGYVNMV